jgi:hypothetical protein
LVRRGVVFPGGPRKANSCPLGERRPLLTEGGATKKTLELEREKKCNARVRSWPTRRALRVPLPGRSPALDSCRLRIAIAVGGKNTRAPLERR